MRRLFALQPAAPTLPGDRERFEEMRDEQVSVT
jgi:hypothetical protein